MGSRMKTVAETENPPKTEAHLGEDRLCRLESTKDNNDTGRFAEVVAVCTCGRRTEFFASEIDGYVFVCNGGVILKYRKDSNSAKTFKMDGGR